MGQVTAFGQAHAHDGVAWLQQGEKHALVGLRTRIRLHIGVLGAEQLLQAVDGQLLDHIDIFATTVIAAARIAFGVFVRQLTALGLHDRWRGVVFRGDQLDVIFLALVFLLHDGPQIGVDQGKGGLVAVKHGGWRESISGVPGLRSCDVEAGLPRRTAEGGHCQYQWPFALPGGPPPWGCVQP